jgi:hypothetical protein
MIVTVPAVQQTTVYSTPAATTLAATSEISTPAGGFATTVTAVPGTVQASSATEEMSTVAVTASYVTVTGTSLSTVQTVISLTRAATETAPATIPMSTSVTVCAACGVSSQDVTYTMTIPANTNTLTVTPATFVTLVPGPSAGISFGNGTSNSTGVNTPILAAQTSSIQTQQVGGAERSSVAWGALFGGLMAAVVLL